MAEAFSGRKEKISVVIPAYNAEETLERAVDSVYGQTYKNVELIVVNDGSKDGTRQCIERLQKKYPELRAINKENGGVSSARNAGIRMAQGTYLVTLDDDDYLDQDMFEKMYERLRTDESDTVICGFRNVYADGRTEEFAVNIDSCFDKAGFINGPLVAMYDKRLISTHSNKLYKLDIIRNNSIYYEEGRQINEDILFCLRYLNACNKISVISKVFMNYVQHGFGESLISSFHEDGISTCFPVMEAMDIFIADSGKPDIKNELHLRMLFHILSFNGLMYRYSAYENDKKLDCLKGFCKNPAFSELLKETRPKDIKTKTAHFLLKNKMYRIYHCLCRILYKERR
ncbi:MAG: glycosyltransferase [Eubacteriales bacterium]|nr:glycosyltransferase [Eubacteriales bacterium]